MRFPADIAGKLQAIDNSACGLPSPPSILVNGTWVNSCPRCFAPAVSDPWRCSRCKWAATKDPHLCCKRVHEVTPVKGDALLADYPVAEAEVQAAKATPVKNRAPKEALLAQAVEAVEADPKEDTAEIAIEAEKEEAKP